MKKILFKIGDILALTGDIKPYTTFFTSLLMSLMYIWDPEKEIGVWYVLLGFCVLIFGLILVIWYRSEYPKNDQVKTEKFMSRMLVVAAVFALIKYFFVREGLYQGPLHVWLILSTTVGLGIVLESTSKISFNKNPKNNQ